MPFSLPRLLSKLQSVITIDTANNDLRIANAVVFSDGTRQTTAGVAVDAFARLTANSSNAVASGAYDKANGAYDQANTATGIAQAAFDSANNVFPQIQPAWNTANTALDNTVYLQTVNDNQNTSISIIQGTNLTQNTRLDGIEGTNATQNTRIGSIETINNNQNTSIEIIQGVDLTQNTRLDGIEGVNLTQNTTITAVNQFAQSAYNKANSNTFIDITVTGNVTANSINTVDFFATANAFVRGSRVLTGDDLATSTHLPVYITMDPALVTVPVVGTSTTYGTYNFGSVTDIQTYGDYNVAANTGFYSVNDATGAPGHVEYIGFTDITDFNRLVLNVNYTQQSGHTQDIDLYNYDTDAWDTFGTYSGSGTWQQIALGLIDSDPYISPTGNVTLRNYHVSNGNVQHRTWFDYIAIEKSVTGGQGPRGATGATGATGPIGPVDSSAANTAQAAYDAANTKLSLSGGTIGGSLIIQNDLSVYGNVAFTGNVTSVQVSGNTGQFFGYASNGFNALYAGIPYGYAVQPETVFQVTSNSDSFAQVNHQNINAGLDASTDFVATADNGNSENTFIDMGINSSTYNNPDFSLTGPNDGYVYVHGNTDTGGGNLIFATMHQNDIIFAVQGQQTENEVMRITSANNVVIKNQLSINGQDWQSVEDTQNTSISIIEGVNTTQNTRLDGIEGVNALQNTNTTAVNNYAVSAYNTANSAQANTIVIQGVDAWQNTQITLAQSTAQAAFDKANTGGSSAGLAGWSVINSNYTVGNNVQLIANTTTSTFTITLPASPVSGNTVVVTDGSITSVGWGNNSVTIARNGSTILGYADDLILNVSRSTATLVYDGGTWQFSSTVGPKGDTGATGPAGANGTNGAAGATGPQGAGANATQRNYRFNATNNQTIFVGGDAYGSSLSYNVSAVSVYLNGVFLRPTEDYVANNGTTIYLNSGTFANDALDVVAFESMSLTAAQNTITTYVYTASAGQTSFGSSDINGKILDYNFGNIFVTLNGLNLRVGTDYLQSNTSYITLTSGANANDEVSIVAFGSFNVQGDNTQNTISSYYYTSTAGQTDFTGADIYGQTLSYMQDGLFVVRNGATLRNKIDYTATNGTTVSLATPTAANDEIAITAVGWFNVAANGYTQVEANNLFLTKTDANNVFASTLNVNASFANTYTQSQANSTFLSLSGGSVTGNTYFGANTFFNSTIFTKGIIENANIIATPITANTNFDVITQAVQYFTANAASNTTINIRGNNNVPLNNLMSVGNTASIVLMFTNGSANTYYPNVIQVDGSPVTPKWQGGTAVTAGNSTATDVYGYTIIKTGNATFTVLASQTKFA